jgi:hypothetical protein
MVDHAEAPACGIAPLAARHKFGIQVGVVLDPGPIKRAKDWTDKKPRQLG